MKDSLRRLGITEQELREAIANEADINAAINDFMANEVVPYARSVAPVRSGKYAAGIKITQKARRGVGVVAATAWYSHFVEDGTGDPGPTPEFAPMQKTASHFGGTIERGKDR